MIPQRASIVAGLLAALALTAGGPAPVQAMTADGTVITNMCSITFMSAYGGTYAVSYSMTAQAIVMGPGPLLVGKTVSPTSMGAGGTLTYCISITNADPVDSAFNVHVIDIIPGVSGVMAYVPGQDNWVTGTAGATVKLGYGAQPPWNGFLYQQWNAECPAGQTGPYGIRWVVSMIGPGKSALVCWKASLL
jgi:uncharacterized repeat protein (TIGR01451 family)